MSRSSRRLDVLEAALLQLRMETIRPQDLHPIVQRIFDDLYRAKFQELDGLRDEVVQKLSELRKVLTP